MIVEIVVLSTGHVRMEQRNWALETLTRETRYQVRLGWGNRKPVTHNRNRIVRRFLEGDADWLLTMDQDVVPQGNPLDYIERDLDVVVFPCAIWNYGNQASKPVVWNIGLENERGERLDGYIPLREPVIEIAEGGTGCILIARRVLEHLAMRNPFYEVVDEDGVSTLGHDLAFCKRAREAGFRVWAAIGCPCSHYDEVDLRTVQRLLMDAEQRGASGRYVAPALSFADQRIVLCCSPGRCGTGYLALALRSLNLEGVRVEHEPVPRFSEALELAQGEPGTAYRFWLEKKLPYIAGIEERVYVETSHVVNKGFLEAILDIGILPDLIVLRRPHREVALSMWRRGDVPARTETGRQFNVCPGNPGVLLLPADGWEAWPDYKLCYWYTLEMEARAKRYAKLFRARGARVHETTLARITTEEGLAELVRQVKLGDLPRRHGEQGEERLGRVNANPEAWADRWPEGDLEGLEAEVREAVAVPAVEWGG